jgi:hypothetical protein
VKFSVVMSLRILLWQICRTSFRLMCGGFASPMPLSNNYSYNHAAFSGLHVGQDCTSLFSPLFRKRIRKSRLFYALLEALTQKL